MPKRKSYKNERVTVPLSMPPELEGKIEEAAKRVKLSKQDTMRMSIERGLDVLIWQLTSSKPEKSHIGEAAA